MECIASAAESMSASTVKTNVMMQANRGFETLDMHFTYRHGSMTEKISR
jgi:hypothetical protein